VSAVLVLAGGSPHAHDFDATGRALVELAVRHGHTADLVDHPDVAAARVAGDGIDVLVVDGLWWRMEGDAYDTWRATYAYSPPPATRAALSDFVASGGGLVAIHTAPICFDDWPQWGDVVGGAWRWGVSSHPPRGPVTATIVADHPVVGDCPTEIHLVDEVYGDLDVRDGVDVLATARRHPDDADQPVVWAHRFGRGRVVFDGFGHAVDSIEHPDNERLVGRAIAWVGGDR
jgi:uncharacterized protein